MVAKTSGNFGTAAWATPAQLKAAGLCNLAAPSTIYLGEDPGTGTEIVYSGDSHLLTVAPPGTGKTAAVVLPSLLYNQGSVVVTDPKGTLTAQTARYRRDQLGQRVFILNPWAHEISDGLGRDLGDTGFNPLSILRASDLSLVDNCEMLGTLLSPTPPDAREKYFTATAATILSRLMLWMTLAEESAPTLPRLYSLCRQPRSGWEDLAARMVAFEGFDFTDYANEILDPLESEKQWAGVVGAMQEATSLYSPHKSLGAHVAKDEFNPSDLKQEDLSVYIVIPSNRRDENKAWLALVLALCAEAVGRAGKARTVTLMAEEFANLGYMPTIARAMAEYREAGLRAHLVVQTPHQLTRIYGREGGQEIINLCGVRQFFGVDDLDLAQDIEKRCGTFTALNRSEGSGPGGSTENVSEMAVPLIRAQDIFNLPAHLQIILMRGDVPPILAHVRPYYTNQTFLDWTDPNPYRDEPQERRAVPFDYSLVETDERSGGNDWVFWAVLAVIVGAVAHFGFDVDHRTFFPRSVATFNDLTATEKAAYEREYNAIYRDCRTSSVVGELSFKTCMRAAGEKGIKIPGVRGNWTFDVE